MFGFRQLRGSSAAGAVRATGGLVRGLTCGVVLLSIANVSCGGDEGESGPGTISWRLDGSEQTDEALAWRSTAPGTDQLLVLPTGESHGPMLVLFGPMLVQGTYECGATTTTTSFPGMVNLLNLDVSSCSVRITKLGDKMNDRIRGTFEAVVTGAPGFAPISLTDGMFDAPLVSAASP